MTIRVLVVDDSPTAREAITAILRRDPEFEIVGEAVDGVEGVEFAERLRPDVITIDINMPRMDGYEATRQIMAKAPTPIVVVSSVSQPEMIQQGLDVLLAGALEIVQKPTGLATQSFGDIAEELIAKVKSVSQIKFKRSTAET